MEVSPVRAGPCRTIVAKFQASGPERLDVEHFPKLHCCTIETKKRENSYNSTACGDPTAILSMCTQYNRQHWGQIWRSWLPLGGHSKFFKRLGQNVKNWIFAQTHLKIHKIPTSKWICLKVIPVGAGLHRCPVAKLQPPAPWGLGVG